MAKCRYCGRDIAPNSQFCPYCNCVNPVKEEENTLSEDKNQDNQNNSVSNTQNLRQEQPIAHTQRSYTKAKKCDRPRVNNDPYVRDVPLDKISGFAIAGFVCSFFFPIIGLPFSITAYYRCKTDYYMTNKRYAVAGIVISAVMLVLLVILFPIILVASL